MKYKANDGTEFGSKDERDGYDEVQRELAALPTFEERMTYLDRQLEILKKVTAQLRSNAEAEAKAAAELALAASQLTDEERRERHLQSIKDLIDLGKPKSWEEFYSFGASPRRG